jgi:hypothetical protein
MEESKKLLIATEPTLTGIPSKLSCHSVVNYGNSLYIFGGFDGETHCDVSDFSIFNMETQEWKKIKKENKWPNSRCISCI